VTGNPVHDFRAYAPGASAVTLNGAAVTATFDGPAPPVSADAGIDAGAPDSGGLCGNCQQPPPDGGSNPPSDAGANPPSDAGAPPSDPPPTDTAPHGCSHVGTAAA
jgi:hypothetical protein